MKRLVPLLLCACLFLSLASSASGRDYPARPVQLVIPFSAGNASDIFARHYAGIASKYLGQAIQCSNISGNFTQEAVAYVYEQPADGYTLLEVTPTLLLSEFRLSSDAAKKREAAGKPIITDTIFFRDEFVPLLKVQSDIQLFGVAADSPFKTIEALITHARENPGKVTIGGISPGGLDEFIARGFAEAAGIQWKYVPFASSDKALEALKKGEIDVYQDKMLRFLPLLEANEMTALVVLHDERIDVDYLRDCPSSTEKGIAFTRGSWRGFVVKKGTPPAIKAKLIDSLKKAYEDPAYVALAKRYKIDIRSHMLEGEAWRTEWDAEYAVMNRLFE
ncbi:hypothetical protein FACS1894158_14900 [Betaproteobacteria bacterium]|nr:hypothetical protein FACS1894158_14900 [Betaproteobacteria bacterium]